MKKAINSIILFATTFICMPLQLFAEQVVDIQDAPVPEAAASHCTIHWGVLGIVAIYGIYAISRALINKKSMSEDMLNSEDR